MHLQLMPFLVRLGFCLRVMVCMLEAHLQHDVSQNQQMQKRNVKGIFFFTFSRKVR